MQLTPAQIELLNSIMREWNRAEEDIKVAEQVCNEIVIPSVKELRYGGRRVVDALTKIAAGGQDEKAIAALLHDAEFDCHRARHDAIDAATSKISLDIEVMVDRLGYEVILPVHPQFPVLVRELHKIRGKIVASRKDRENREGIYAVLEATDFAALVKSFNEMRTSEEIMKAIAKRRRRSEAIGVAGAIFGVIGIILAVYFGLK